MKIETLNETAIEKIKYCLGFVFNQKETDVLLIEKQKPDWQKGLLNGIGGKVEKTETSRMAIVREFHEETGLIVDLEEWRYVVTIGDDDWECDVFTTKSDAIFEAKTMETEEVLCIELGRLESYGIIDNLFWLIEMCRDMNINYKIFNNNNK